MVLIPAELKPEERGYIGEPPTELQLEHRNFMKKCLETGTIVECSERWKEHTRKKYGGTNMTPEELEIVNKAIVQIGLTKDVQLYKSHIDAATKAFEMERYTTAMRSLMYAGMVHQMILMMARDNTFPSTYDLISERLTILSHHIADKIAMSIEELI